MNRCSLCGNEAIARMRLTAGCAARPGDREQMVCLHHVMRMRPLGPTEILEDYSEDEEFSRFWRDL